jgi:hypothetical protein
MPQHRASAVHALASVADEPSRGDETAAREQAAHVAASRSAAILKSAA